MDKARADTAKKLVSQYQKVFGSVEGKAVLYDLMRVNFILTPTLGEDVNLTLVHEGQRNTILRILTILKMDPAKLRGTIEEEESHV